MNDSVGTLPYCALDPGIESFACVELWDEKQDVPLTDSMMREKRFGISAMVLLYLRNPIKRLEIYFSMRFPRVVREYGLNSTLVTKRITGTASSRLILTHEHISNLQIEHIDLNEVAHEHHRKRIFQLYGEKNAVKWTQELGMSFVTITLNTMVNKLGPGLFARLSVGNLTERHNALAQSIKDAEKLTFYCTSGHDDVFIELWDRLQHQNPNPYSILWEDHPSRHFFDSATELKHPSDSDFEGLFTPGNTKLAYVTYEEYTAHMGTATIWEHFNEVKINRGGGEKELGDNDNIPSKGYVLQPDAQNDKSFFLCYRVPEGLTRPRPGTCLEVRFHTENPKASYDPHDDSHGFNAIVLDSLPGMPPMSVVCLMTRPTEPGTNKTIYPTDKKFEPKVHQLTRYNESRMSSVIKKIKPIHLWITRSDANSRMCETSIEALRVVFESRSGKSALIKLLLANNTSPDSFEPVNLYGELPPEDANYVERVLHDKKQSSVVKGLQHLNGPLCCLHGPAGTGKTTVLLTSLLPMLKLEPRRQCLLVGPTNASADDLYQRTTKMATEHAKYLGRPLNIYRLHVGSAETSVYMEQLYKNKKVDTGTDDHFAHIDGLSLCDVWTAKLNNKIDEASTLRTKDSRLVHIKSSLAYGYLDGDEISRETFMKTFMEACEGLRNETVKQADIITGTMFSVTQQYMRDHFKPTAICIDEAGLVTDPQIHPLLAWFTQPQNANFKALILAGDHHQLHPMTLSSEKDNPNHKLLETSFFARIAPYIQKFSLNTQYRMVSHINDMISYLFYNGEIGTGDVTKDPKTQSLVSAVSNFNKQIFNKDSNLIFVNIRSTRVARRFTSLSNPKQAAAGVALCEKLLGHAALRHILPPEDIVIIVAYQAQYQEYRNQLSARASRVPGLSKVLVRKADAYQGGEAAVSIFDFTPTEARGFLNDPTRLNVANSRGKFGHYLLINFESVDISLRSQDRRRRDRSDNCVYRLIKYGKDKSLVASNRDLQDVAFRFVSEYPNDDAIWE
ncbi:hypothetical protein N7456_013674 [Penicillium angulare]|uniref:DNA2/NAM7 helicase-like C-terminal domain-containing protein n=1 Tax=Penicillium angulare TaxID=116970 RepID=A0A9W9EFQ3_9EURO|nr:hypothetical protein N7456_013674 [Penicillium angulare]